MNFGSMLQLKNAWNTFIGNHPKFPRFLRAAGSCISKDTIIEIKVTTAEGRVLETNLKVKESDIDLLKSLAKLGFLLLFHCFLWYNKSSEKGAEKHMAGNSKDSKILAYKDMINQLNKTISTQTELIQSLQKHWKQTVWKKKTFVSRLNISRRSFLVLPVKNGKISMVS